MKANKKRTNEKIPASVFYIIAVGFLAIWLVIQITDVFQINKQDQQTTVETISVRNIDGSIYVTIPKNIPYSEDQTILPYLVLEYQYPEQESVEITLFTLNKFQLSAFPGEEKNWSNWLPLPIKNGQPVTIYLNLPQHKHAWKAEYFLHIVRAKQPIVFQVQGYWQGILSKLVQICKDFGFPASIIIAVAGWVIKDEENRKKEARKDRENRITQHRKYIKRHLVDCNKINKSEPFRHLTTIISLFQLLTEWGDETQMDMWEEYRSHFGQWFGGTALYPNLSRALYDCGQPDFYLQKIVKISEKLFSSAKITDQFDPFIIDQQEVASYLTFLDDENKVDPKLTELCVIYIYAAWKMNPQETIKILGEKSEKIKAFYRELFLDSRLFELREQMQSALNLEMNITDSGPNQIYWEHKNFHPKESPEAFKIDDYQTPFYYSASDIRWDKPAEWIEPTALNLDQNIINLTPLDWDAKFCLRQYSHELGQVVGIKNSTFVVILPFLSLSDMTEDNISIYLRNAIADTWKNFLYIYPRCFQALDTASQALLVDLFLDTYGLKESLIRFYRIQPTAILDLSGLTSVKAQEQTTSQYWMEKKEYSLKALIHELEILFESRAMKKKSIGNLNKDAFTIKQYLSLRPSGFTRTLILFSFPDMLSIQINQTEQIKRLITAIYRTADTGVDENVFFNGFFAKLYQTNLSAIPSVRVNTLSWEEIALKRILDIRLPAESVATVLGRQDNLFWKALDRSISCAGNSPGRMIKQLRAALVTSGLLPLFIQSGENKELTLPEEKQKMIQQVRHYYLSPENFNNE